jgi:aspartyl-tRNA(Asn)/glutamyl-tRNA(Gln) amidotransferase subunit C
MSQTKRVTIQELRKVAHLAHLSLNREEESLYTRQLDRILDYMEQLDEVDTSQVEPLSHVLELKNVTRPDEPEPSLPQEVVLESAPVVKDGSIEVPAIMDRRSAGKKAR